MILCDIMVSAGSVVIYDIPNVIEVNTYLEKFGHFLDREVQRLFDTFKQGSYAKKTISEHIKNSIFPLLSK